MDPSMHRPYTGTSFILFGAVYAMFGLGTLFYGLYGVTQESGGSLVAYVFLGLVGLSMAGFGALAVTAGAQGLRGAWTLLKPTASALAAMFVVIGVSLIVVDIAADPFESILVPAIFALLAGVLGLVAVNVHRAEANAALTAGILAGIAGIFVLVAGVAAEGPADGFLAHGGAAAAVLAGLGVLTLGAAVAVHAMVPARAAIATVAVTAGAALFWGIGKLLEAIAVLEAEPLALAGVPALLAVGNVFAFIGSLAGIVGFLGILTAATLAIVGQAMQLAAPAERTEEAGAEATEDAEPLVRMT